MKKDFIVDHTSALNRLCKKKVTLTSTSVFKTHKIRCEFGTNVETVHASTQIN